jgi:beta-aspartyl-peptidase (threonine type)
MIRIFLLFSLLILSLAGFAQKAVPEERPSYVLVVHGGAGTMEWENMSAESRKAYETGLLVALKAGEAVLKSGGSSIDAVVAAIVRLEDNPLFNAGRGAVYNEVGQIAHDASIMEGSQGKAGAVGMVSNIKNPILAAKAVMDDGRHVFLVGSGAERFAISQGVDTASADYFYTKERFDAWEKTRKTRLEREFPLSPKGTVGAVALDMNGNLAAGTSTGGMHFKRVGRLGDSPVIGAGTWADNNTCAVSATGHGEYFIRNVVASDISARMKYLGESLEQAANAVIMGKLTTLDAGGGIIAIDRHGNIAMPFNTSGMFRGYVKAGQTPFVAVSREK